LVTENAVKV